MRYKEASSVRLFTEGRIVGGRTDLVNYGEGIRDDVFFVR